MNLEQEQHPHLHLFTLRLWAETLGPDNVEWRGRIQEVTSGETLFFRDWPGLVATLQRLVGNVTAAQNDSPGQLQHTHENEQ